MPAIAHWYSEVACVAPQGGEQAWVLKFVWHLVIASHASLIFASIFVFGGRADGSTRSWTGVSSRISPITWDCFCMRFFVFFPASKFKEFTRKSSCEGHVLSLPARARVNFKWLRRWFLQQRCGQTVEKSIQILPDPSEFIASVLPLRMRSWLFFFCQVLVISQFFWHIRHTQWWCQKCRQ